MDRNMVEAIDTAAKMRTSKKDKLKFFACAVPYVMEYSSSKNPDRMKCLVTFRSHFITGEPLNIVEYCEGCGNKMKYLPAEGKAFCEVCCITHKKCCENFVASYQETTIIYNNYCYEKRARFKEWLYQVQGKKGDIPARVINLVRDEQKKDRIPDCEMTWTKVIAYLKLVNERSYYDVAIVILHHINGYPLPNLTNNDINFFSNEFTKILISFLKHKPKSRKSFFKHSYTLHKISEEYKQYNCLVKYFPLLKSDANLKLYDNVWCLICKDIGYTFRKSI